MSFRTIIAGLLGGIGSTVLLAVPMLVMIPAMYATDWPQINPFLGTLSGIVAGLTIIIAAGLGVRWEGTPDRRFRLQRGAVIGSMSAIVAWLVVGSASAGILGHTAIFSHGIRPAGSDAAIAILIYQSVTETTYWHYGLFWYSLFGGTMLGMLGGYLMGRHFPAQHKHRVHTLSLQVWKMVAVSTLMVLLVLLIVMPPIYYLLSEKTAQISAKNLFPQHFSAEAVFNYPVAMIYLTLAMVERWAWYLIALDRVRTHGQRSGGLFRMVITMLPLATMGLIALVNPSLLRNPVSQLGSLAVGFSIGIGAIHTRWGPSPSGRQLSDSSMAWHDWICAMILSVIVCAALIQLIAIGIPLSLVMISIVYIGVLSGTEQASAIPSVSEAMASLIMLQQQMGLFTGVLIQLLLLPFFLLYTWIRGTQTKTPGS